MGETQDLANISGALGKNDHLGEVGGIPLVGGVLGEDGRKNGNLFCPEQGV